THRTSVGVREHTKDVCGCLWLSVSTQDVRGCPCVSTSVAVRVCPSAHRGRPWLSISTHINTLVLGLSTLALPVDYLGDFGPRGLSVQYTGHPCHTQDVCGCPSAHTRCSCVSVSTHRSSVAVRVCPCVSVSTHRTSVAFHQYTYRYVGPWTQHAGPSCGLFGTHRTFVGVRQQTQDDVRGCLSAHTRRPCVSVSTHRTSVAVRQHTQDVCGCPCVSVCVRQHTHDDIRGFPSVHISVRWSLDSARWPFPWTAWVILAHVGCLFSTHRTFHTQDVRGCPSAHTGRMWLSVCVRQHTQDDVCGCPSAHTGRLWLSVCVRLCPSAHTGRLWVSVSTNKMSVCVRQHTQDICGCPCVTHRTFVAVNVCPCVSVSTHRTSVAVHQYTYQHHVGPWTQHAGPSRILFG
ncbi:unnamed protein product, partial [Brassica rapa]